MAGTQARRTARVAPGSGPPTSLCSGPLPAKGRPFLLLANTTHICRYLHGKTFAVADALQRFDRVEELERPEKVKREPPWVREALDPETRRTRFYVDGGAGRTDLAEVSRSALGTRDDRGDFRPLASDAALREVGIGFPPYYGLCRTMTLAVV